MTAIWWIRRDLRIRNNAALEAAGSEVVPLFVVDPRLINSGAHKRIDFMYSALASLDQDLRELGSRLVVRHGTPESVIPALSQELGGAQVFAEEDFTPFSRGRDRKLSERASIRFLPGLTVHHPDEVLKPSGDPYRVFSQFKKRWNTLPFAPVADIGDSTRLKTPNGIMSDPLPGPQQSMNEGNKAQEALKRFLHSHGSIWNYENQRNRIDLDGTSGLSPFIRFGMVSVSELFETAKALISGENELGRRESAESWLNEIIWREFFQSAIYHFPHSAKESLRPDLVNIKWINDEDDFAAWTEGRTGFPIVDAGMRQLKSEGLIHTRLRMIVASFLVKDLLINWKWGERWFMRHLIDGDPAANIGGWQWTAGAGLDAAPYFRVFNPTLQAKKFDPHGTFIRKWIPELKAVPDRYIHTPWEWPSLGKNSLSIDGYPFPIVDHSMARKRALAAFEASRRVSQATSASTSV